METTNLEKKQIDLNTDQYYHIISFAIESGKINVIKMLIDKGADINKIDAGFRVDGTQPPDITYYVDIIYLQVKYYLKTKSNFFFFQH